MKQLGLIFLLAISLFAVDIDKVIKQMEDKMRGKSMYGTFTIEVQTSRTERKISVESWSIGNEKSFMRINYPKKDKGITFLKVDKQMWQYVPKIEKTIKIPASMMMQSWMGTDFSNDDMVKESSMSDDYHVKLLEETPTHYKVELIPKEDAAVVWGKIIMTINIKYLLPEELHYFDEDGFLERKLFYEEIKRVGDRDFPTRWVMRPMSEDKKENITTITIDEIKFDVPVDEDLFTKRALKKMSR